MAPVGTCRELSLGTSHNSTARVTYGLSLFLSPYLALAGGEIHIHIRFAYYYNSDL